MYLSNLAVVVDHQSMVFHYLMRLVFDSSNEVIVEHFVIEVNKDLPVEIHWLV